MINISIQPCLTEAEILATYEVLKELRPHLQQDQYLSIMKTLSAEGAHLVGLFDSENKCLGVAVFRIHSLTFLNGQKDMYIDDLVVSENERSQGLGSILMDWLKSEAKKRGCVSVSLDSAAHRTSAHRFYRREGFDGTTLHFRYPI